MRRAASRLAGWYALAAGAWVLVGLLPRIPELGANGVVREVVLGAAFVAVTSGLLYLWGRKCLAAFRATEEAHERTERELDAVLRASPVAIVTLDEERRTYLYNPAAEALLGWSADEVMGRVHPAFSGDRENPELQALARAVSERSVAGWEFRPLRKDGSRGEILVFTRAIEGAGPGQANHVAVMIDITERVRVKAELRAARRVAEESRDTLARVLDRVSDGIVSFDAELRHVYLNPVALANARRPLGDLVGRTLEATMEDLEGSALVPALRRALAEQRPVEIEEYVPVWDRWFESRLYPSADGVTMFFRDVTAQRRAETAARASEARLRLACRAANVGLWDWDLETDEAYFSPEWKSQLGHRPDDIPDRFEEWERRLHPEDRARTLAAVQGYAADPRGEYEAEFRLRHRDGTWRWIYTHAAVVEADGSRRMLGCHVDVTERHRATDEILRSREEIRALVRASELARESERTRIARELHDDLGQALTSLGLDLAALQASAPASARWAHARLAVLSAHVEDALERVRRIATELRPGVLDHLGLAAAVEWQVREFGARARVSAQVDAGEVGDIDPEVATAAFRVLQEALTNVLRHAAASRVEVGLHPDGDGVRLEVRDDGRGLGAARPGALGLVGVRERVTILGGRFTIGPADGGGTLLCAWFPRTSRVG